MLSWRLRPLAVQLRGFGRHPLLQAPFLPALQGEGELQPSDQVCIGQARSRGANSTDGGTNSAGGCWILLIMLSSLKWALRAEVWKPCSFFTIVTCCMLCSSSGDTRTYRFHIPLCASSITLLNHGVDVISEEIVEIAVHQVLGITSSCGASIFQLCWGTPFFCLVWYMLDCLTISTTLVRDLH